MWWQSNTTIKISIHALLAESDPSIQFQHPLKSISIHALLAESDPVVPAELTTLVNISIHALLAESDVKNTSTSLNIFKFLSTLSLRRATI